MIVDCHWGYYNCKATKREKPEKQIEMSLLLRRKVGEITSFVLVEIIKEAQSAKF